MFQNDRDGDAGGVSNITLDVASVAANTSAEQTFTVPGLSTDMVVFLNKSDLDAGLVVGNARVSAADTLAVTFGNLTASPIDPASEVYKLFWIKPNSTPTGAAKV
jgi:hypothetical protein